MRHRKPTILVVDNDPDLLKMVGQLLKSEGYAIVEMEDPREALTFY
jgi:CheY-like chemotaxis protein